MLKNTSKLDAVWLSLYERVALWMLFDLVTLVTAAAGSAAVADVIDSAPATVD